MKPRSSNQRSHALTLVESLMGVAVLFFLVIFFLPAFVATNRLAIP